MSEIYKEHTLQGGNVITLTNQGDNPRKPWQVVCWESASSDAECRWVKEFATEAEAEKEYIRFD